MKSRPWKGVSSRKQNSISKTYKCFWPVESKVYPCRFYSYLRVNVNILALFPVSIPSTHSPTMHHSLHPLRQCEARNSIRFITEPPEISAFSARSWTREGATDPRMYRTRTRPRQIPRLWNNRWQWSSGWSRRWRKSEQRANFTHMKKTLKENLLEEGPCVPWTKIWTAPFVLCFSSYIW